MPMEACSTSNNYALVIGTMAYFIQEMEQVQIMIVAHAFAF